MLARDAHLHDLSHTRGTQYAEDAETIQAGAEVNWTLHCGEALSVLRTLPDQSASAVITSPPYYAQRDYGVDGQLGRERTPAEFVGALVAVFAEAWRVLEPRGNLLVNMGDSYQCAKGQAGGIDPKNPARRHGLRATDMPIPGLKPKDLIGVPWMLALALREAGWYLRELIVWHKPNGMPSSVADRCTLSHEYVLHLTRARRYYWGGHEIREPYSAATLRDFGAYYESDGLKDYAAAGVQNPSDIKRRIKDKQRGHSRQHAGFNARWDAMTREQQMAEGSNARSVWTIATEPSQYEHFAVMPRALARKLVLAGAPAGGTVLDPFAGVATTGVVALEEGRSFVGIELNPKYAAMARERLANVAPLLATEQPA